MPQAIGLAPAAAVPRGAIAPRLAAGPRRPGTSLPPGRGRTYENGRTRRARRSPGASRSRPAVAVTGAAHGLGLALAARLAASPRFGRVIAIDDHRGELAGVTWRVADVRDPAVASRLAGIDVIVHADLDLAADSDDRARRAYNVRGAQTVLTAAAAGGV